MRGEKMALVEFGPANKYKIWVEVDGFFPNGTPFIRCKQCGERIPASLYYEIGCQSCNYGVE